MEHYIVLMFVSDVHLVNPVSMNINRAPGSACRVEPGPSCPHSSGQRAIVDAEGPVGGTGPRWSALGAEEAPLRS